jgi:hypothetical protein
MYGIWHTTALMSNAAPDISKELGAAGATSS